MCQKQTIGERKEHMTSEKIIVELLRHLEQQNLISPSERMKVIDIFSRGH